MSYDEYDQPVEERPFRMSDDEGMDEDLEPLEGEIPGFEFEEEDPDKDS